jgi:hypothetical protein
MPVANNDEDQQQECDEQQAGCFGSIGRVPAVLMGGILLTLNMSHGVIVRSARIWGGVVIGCGAGCKLIHSSSEFSDFLFLGFV